MNLVELELFGIVLNCLELLKSYKWTGLDGLDGWILLRSLVHLEPLRRRDGRGGLFFCGAGQGKKSAGRGGAKKRVNRLIQKN